MDEGVSEETPVSDDSEGNAEGAAQNAPAEGASSNSNGTPVEVTANSDFDSVAKIGVPNDVGSDGAFAYSLPIKIPEFRGLEPKVALSYNSGRRTQRGVDNIIGQGWRLSGFSKIERVTAGRGIASYDDANDILLLDGQELVACDANAAYHADYKASEPAASCTAGGDFTTLRESYLKIERDGSANTFTVTNKDGVTYTYEAVVT